MEMATYFVAELIGMFNRVDTGMDTEVLAQ